MFGLAPQELIAVAVIAVLLFGSKLPEVARSLGGSYREFRRGLNDMQQQFREVEREVAKAIDTPATKKVELLEDEELDQEPAAPKFSPPPASNVEAKV
jgi:sec-independent protein translocase protein TatA